jgi:hypothetical protein
VVFIPVDQTAGLFNHAFILFFNVDNLHTANGAYKTEALGGGKRNIIGVPAFVAPVAPHPVTASAQLTIAANQDCGLPVHLLAPWASCSWQNCSILIQTNISIARLRESFAQTARCFTAHPMGYNVLGPNSNTYIYTALRNAGIDHPGGAPGDVVATGWGTETQSVCTLH